MQISHLDHLVLTVESIPAAIEFYTRVMGMEAITFGEGRKALKFGSQKINLHPTGQSSLRVAKTPLPSSADLCFITATPIEEVVAHLQANNVPIEEGPVLRSGAMGHIKSVYFRDPDENLIEVSNYL